MLAGTVNVGLFSLKKRICYDRWRRLAKALPRLQLCLSAPTMQYASVVTYSRGPKPEVEMTRSRHESA
jgi:hypothetical protein